MKILPLLFSLLLGQTLTAEHLTLYYPDGSDENIINQLLNKTERLTKEQIEHFALSGGQQLTIKISATIQEYRQICRASWPSGGSYLPHEDLICLPPISQLYQMENMDALLAHEITHALLHKQLSHCPAWVEEYLALKSEKRIPANCPADTQQCPSRQELLYPKNKNTAHRAYCQTYHCGTKFITSQKPAELANICQTFTDRKSSESLGNK